MKNLMFIFLFLLILKITPPVNTGHIYYMLNKVRETQYDGPYVNYQGKEIFIHYILDNKGTKTVKTQTISLQQKDDLLLKVNTDIAGTAFSLRLKKTLPQEKSVFPASAKLLVLSDIEGNFTAMRKLLAANKVIDKDFNWIFGKGNLVLTGDFFDRGEQVTEVLWLIYYLEEKAKARGGYVHFLLGNHEIMNLNGDLRYLPQKYLDNANLLQRKYLTLYDENSELGRWLRTKNIIEKIGNIVFVHGGISAEINAMNLPVAGINDLTRPYYADSAYDYTDDRLDILLGNLGPFWYRGYYDKNNPLISSQLDKSLTLFEAKHIITGHTIVSDSISMWFGGKLFNTDVHHAEGKSEALLIENNSYYRVNARGKKVLLLAGD